MRHAVKSFVLLALVLQLITDVSPVSSIERRRYKRGWMSGTKPPNATCTFNPCDIPNFCDGGRKCELDESCKHHCSCTEESVHESCAATSSSTTDPEITSAVTTQTVICSFNPCNIPNFCSGGRECTIDESCRHKCVCTDQSTHELCVSTTSADKPAVVSITTPSVISCAFNPCIIPNFCSGGRDCIIDESCRHKCVCTAMSTHESCLSVTIETEPEITLKTTTPSVTCAFNPCGIPDFCGVGRLCKMDESCRHKCVCKENSNHELCVNISTSTRTPVVTSKPTTITTFNCVINPCSVENFCGIGRRCEIDSTCKHRCVCLDNLTHADCLGTHSTTTPAVVCAFNPCSTPNFNFCGEGRRCEFNRKSCKHTCVCLDDVTHDDCKPDDLPEVTQSPPDDSVGRNCPPGFPCKHGYCEPPGYKCVCDDNWTGVFCDKDMRRNCTRECEEGSKCMILPNFTEVCVKIQLSTTTTSKFDGDASNACSSSYKLRNETERTCLNGMVCHFGVCVDMGEGRGKCECDPGAVGVQCLRKCCRDCGENGECFLDGIEEICNCHYNYTGSDCSELKPQEGPPEEVTWYWWIVGVCSAVLALLIVLLLVVPYVMWKYRVIMVMKIVHYFQSYEDDDERQWDAFISYSQRDYRFVVNTLYPKLELEQGFKLIMHHRDFLGGETIANNIINAVKNSRRTILVITPNFVKSEYTRFEYQVAQQEMLKRKHRIIPVLLDDISECKSSMDPHLKSILSSVTYLEWPKESDSKKTERFWKRLQLSLPKKRQNSDTNKTSASETIRPDDIKISVGSDKSSFVNGDMYSNKVFYSEPEEDYDTINELELDHYRNSTNKLSETHKTNSDTDRYITIDAYR